MEQDDVVEDGSQIEILCARRPTNSAAKRRLENMTGISVMPSATTVTRAAFEGLYNGIPYPVAVEIIGAPGQELSRSDVEGVSTVIYAWKNADGSNMNAMFQNGRLVQKAQFGLK